MKKLLFALGAALALTGSAYAQDAFVPESGVKYSFCHKESDVYLGARNDLVKLMTASRTDKDAFEWVAEPSGDGYLIRCGLGTYIYKDGYNTKLGDVSKASVFTFQPDGEYYRIVTGSNCLAPDRVGAGEGVWSDKSLTFPNGLYTIVRSADIAYTASVRLAMSEVSIMKDNEGVNSTTLRFTPVNFDGEVTVTASEGFTADPDKATVTDGEEVTVTVSSEGAIGTTGTVTIAFGGETLATAAVTVIEPAPMYYIFNLETGLVLGGDTEKAVLSELTQEDTQRFSKIEVPGSNGQRFYLVQKSSGLYFRNVDSGSGVMAHYCEYGPSAERAEWSMPANGDGVSLRNSKQDRILIPTKLAEGAQVMCYGLNSDAGSQWQLTAVSEFTGGEPTVDIKDENVLVEPDGMSFTTEVRAYNLDGGIVEVRPSAGVQVSLSTLEDSYKRVPLTISTSAKAGTECKIDFVLGARTLYTLSFTVRERFPRYVFRYVLEGSDLAMGSAPESAQPVFVEYDIDDVNQQMILMPANDEGGYYIIQEGSYGYLSHTGNGWDTTFGTAKAAESTWTLEPLDEESGLVQLRGSRGLLDADDYTAGAKLYCNKSKGTWTLQAIGDIFFSTDEVVLPARDATEKVKVMTAGLKEAITVTATGAATVDVSTLPAEGGELTVGLKADGSEISGTVTLTSGNFTNSFEVRLKATTLNVDKDAVEIVGKRGKAIFNVSATDITEPVIVAVEGEGFAVNVASIEAAAKVSRDVTVTYTGRAEATGKVTVSCAGITRTVGVSVKFNPAINIDEDGFALEEGIAYFSVTAVDIFDPIRISTDVEGVEIAPEELEADADDAYVFVTVPETVKAEKINILVKSGDITRTLVLENSSAGIAAVDAAAIHVFVKDGAVRAEGAAEGARIMVSDLTGRTVTAPAAAGVALGHKGVYIVKVIGADGVSRTVKVIY